MITTDNLAFAHFPKTGGTWVRKVFEKIPHKEIHGNHFPIMPINSINSIEDSLNFSISKCKLENKFIFSFKRNPQTWYPSMYCHKKATNPKRWEDVSYVKFLNTAIEIDTFNRLQRAFEDISNFIGTQENLKNDLKKVFDLSGEKYDKNTFNIKPQNCREHTNWITEEELDYGQELISTFHSD